MNPMPPGHSRIFEPGTLELSMVCLGSHPCSRHGRRSSRIRIRLSSRRANLQYEMSPDSAATAIRGMARSTPQESIRENSRICLADGIVRNSPSVGCSQRQAHRPPTTVLGCLVGDVCNLAFALPSSTAKAVVSPIPTCPDAVCCSLALHTDLAK
jgi:hypothetical protein